MASQPTLSTGSIDILTNTPENAFELGSAPLMQCLKVELLRHFGSSNDNRYSIVLGDGVTWVHNLLSRSLNHLIDSGKLVRGCICRLHQVDPHLIKGRMIFQIHHLEVLEEFGILKTIGKLARVQVTSGNAAAYRRTVDFRPGYSLPYELPITRFPPEICRIIVSYLDQVDKLALSLTSKRLQMLVGTSLYSDVRFRSKDKLVKFVKTITSRPELCDAIRTYWLEGDICCADEGGPGTHFDLDRFTLLRELHYRPAHEAIIECSWVLSIFQKIVTGQMIQWLRRLHIHLNYTHPPGLDDYSRTSEKLFQAALAAFSTPSLEHISLFYQPHNVNEDYHGSHFEVRHRDPPMLTETKITRLQTLDLQWNGLPLPWLSAFFQLPRNLEMLTLSLSLRYSHTGPDSPMPLDTALAPLVSSLEALRLVTVEEINDAPEDVGLRFSSTGLSQFQKLRELYLPGTFLTPNHGFTGRTPWFPPSLRSLCLTDARLWKCRAPEPSVVNPISNGQHFVMLDPDTENCLARLSGMLDMVPNLATFVLHSASHGHLTDHPRFRFQAPPALLVRKDQQPLVDRRIRIILEMSLLPDLELEVIVMPDLYLEQLE